MTHRAWYTALLILITGIGCALKDGAVPPMIDAKPAPPLILYQLKAMDYERQGDHQQALIHYKIAEALMTERILAATAAVGNHAEHHFQKGRALLAENQDAAAAEEFLKALIFDAGRIDALEQLRKTTGPRRTLTYTVKQRDTFAAIAGEVYKNPNLADLVAFFFGPDRDRDLTPGEVLTLPVAELSFTRRFFNFTRDIALARKRFKQKDYEQVLPLAEAILRHRPGNDEALFLINSSCDALAEQLVRERRYQEALAVLRRIDPRFRNVKTRIKEIETLQANVFAADTENKNAAHYRKGRDLFKQGRHLEALAAFQSVDPAYADVQERIAEIRDLVKQRAEIHYRNGVKCFLNENLEGAIAEWKQALALDPENVQVRKDMDNALELLRKINELQ
ncbi:hypothetical protein JCM14469_09920 [Desulfatiferula olefinivorans]